MTIDKRTEWTLAHTLVAGAILLAVVVALVTDSGQAHTTVLAGLVLLVAVWALSRVHFSFWKMRRYWSHARESAAQAEQHYLGVLKRIMQCVESRDKYTIGHSERVGRLAVQMSQKLGLSDEICQKMEMAGYLHDIGMIAVPEHILAQQSSLGVENFRTVQKHSEVGYEVLLPLESLAEVLPAIRFHHERMNGTGYPSGLEGASIPIEARILAVADAYDAMTHDRPHRPAMSPLVAMKELQRCTPAGYDPRCVNVLADLMNLPLLEEAMDVSGLGVKAHS